MITSNRFSPVRFTLLAGSCALVLGAYSALPLFAATPPPDPVPTVSITVEKTSEKSTTKAPSSTTAQNGSSSSSGRRGNGFNQGGNGYQNGNNSSQSSSASSDVTYSITIRNTSKVPAKNLEVEYHFYNKTTDTNNGESTRTIADITSIEHVDVDPSKVSTPIETQPISHASSMSKSSGGSVSGGGFGRTASPSGGSSKSSTTSLLGWHVEVRYNGKVIRHADNPDNLTDLLKEYPDFVSAHPELFKK